MFFLTHQQAIARMKVSGKTPWSITDCTVAQYKLNDNLTTTAVIDTEGTNGTASANTSTLSTTGKINEAFDFDGSTTYVDCNQTFQATFRDEFNISCWIKLDDGQPATTQLILGLLPSSVEDVIQLFVDTAGKISFYYESNNNVGYATSNAVIFADGATSWTHIICNISSTQIAIYINGENITLDSTNDGDMSGVTMGDYASALNLFVGARNDSGVASNYFAGLIDDFRIHDRVLTATEISGIYNHYAGTEAQSGTFTPWTTPWDSDSKSSAITLSNNNYTAINASGGYHQGVLGLQGYSTGKYYFEIVLSGSVLTSRSGVATSAESLTSYDESAMIGNYQATASAAYQIIQGAATLNSGLLLAVGDTVMFAYDFDNGKWWQGVDGVWVASGDPASGTNEISSFTTGSTFFPFFSAGAGMGCTLNKTPTYTIPTGFSLWE